MQLLSTQRAAATRYALLVFEITWEDLAVTGRCCCWICHTYLKGLSAARFSPFFYSSVLTRREFVLNFAIRKLSSVVSSKYIEWDYLLLQYQVQIWELNHNISYTIFPHFKQVLKNNKPVSHKNRCGNCVRKAKAYAKCFEQKRYAKKSAIVKQFMIKIEKNCKMSTSEKEK